MYYVDSALDPAAEDRLAAWPSLAHRHGFYLRNPLTITRFPLTQARLAAWPASEPQTASALTLRTGFHSVAA